MLLQGKHLFMLKVNTKTMSLKFIYDIQLTSSLTSLLTISPREFLIVENIRLVCPVRFDSSHWSQNKRKVDAEFPAARGEQNI